MLISQEILEDAIVDILSFALDTLATRVARGENNLFTVGDGTGDPNGIVTASTAVSPDQDPSGDAIINLFHSVDPAYRNANARFMAHDTIWAEVRKLKDTTNQYLWQPGLQLGQPDRLLGFPTVMNQDMITTTTANDRYMLFGDISKYIIRDVASGLRLKVFRELYGASDQIGVSALIRIDGDLLDAGTNPVKHLEGVT